MSYRNHPIWVKVWELYRDEDTPTGIKLALAQIMFGLEAEYRDYPEEDFSRVLEGARVSWIPQNLSPKPPTASGTESGGAPTAGSGSTTKMSKRSATTPSTPGVADDEELIRNAAPEELAAILRELGYIVTEPSRIKGLL